jgi:hypothetical protein
MQQAFFSCGSSQNWVRLVMTVSLMTGDPLVSGAAGSKGAINNHATAKKGNLVFRKKCIRKSKGQSIGKHLILQ